MTEYRKIMNQPLLVADRCDQCGAQAYVRVTLESGTELLFCAHDANKNMDRLMLLDGANIFDEREKLDAVS